MKTMELCHPQIFIANRSLTFRSSATYLQPTCPLLWLPDHQVEAGSGVEARNLEKRVACTTVGDGSAVAPRGQIPNGRMAGETVDSSPAGMSDPARPGFSFPTVPRSNVDLQDLSHNKQFVICELMRTVACTPYRVSGDFS